MMQVGEGIYLKCDPYGGWSVIGTDGYGNTRQIVDPVPTMEEALRRLSISGDEPVYVKLIPESR
jgi:hypothetical protein